jgi:hypothetical protein
LPLREEAGISLGTSTLPLLFAASLVVTVLVAPAAASFLARAGGLQHHQPQQQNHQQQQYHHARAARALRRLYLLLAAVLVAFYALYLADAAAAAATTAVAPGTATAAHFHEAEVAYAAALKLQGALDVDEKKKKQQEGGAAAATADEADRRRRGRRRGRALFGGGGSGSSEADAPAPPAPATKAAKAAANAKAAARGDPGLTPGRRLLRASFYVAANALNLVAAASMWSRCADAFSAEAARRLYGVVSAGATLGQLFGSLCAVALTSAANVAPASSSPSAGGGAHAALLLAAGLMVLGGQLGSRVRPAAAVAAGAQPQNGSNGGSIANVVAASGAAATATPAPRPAPLSLAATTAKDKTSDGGGGPTTPKAGADGPDEEAAIALLMPPAAASPGNGSLSFTGASGRRRSMSKTRRTATDPFAAAAAAVAPPPPDAGSASPVPPPLSPPPLPFSPPLPTSSLLRPTGSIAFPGLPSAGGALPAFVPSQDTAADPAAPAAAASTTAISSSVPRCLRRACGDLGSGFAVILRSPYLMLLCAFTLYTTSVGSLLYFQRAIVVSTALPPSGRAAFFARVQSCSAALIAFFQLFATGSILRRIGVSGGLLLAPAVCLATALAVSRWPTAAAVAGCELVRKVAGYSVTRPAREVLFTVVSREEKIRGKVVLDSVVQRLGDALAAAAFALLDFWVGRQQQHAGAAAVGLLAAFGCGAWAWVATRLGKQHVRLARQAAMAAALRDK